MAGINITLRGLDKTLANLDIKKLTVPIQDELEAFAKNTVQMAQANAPVDEGYLREQIGFEIFPLNVKIFAAATYSAYLEFGTRKFAAAYVGSLPATWQEMAAETRGKAGGTMDEFIQNIMAWVLRKGIGADLTKSKSISKTASSLDKMQSAAYAIALNILQNGIKPHPFLYPAFETNRLLLIERLKALSNA
jgi:hypothetical protein